MPAPEMNEDASFNSASLNRAVDLMRDSVPVRDDWRDGLLREVAQLPHPEQTLPASFLPEVRGRTPALRRSFSVQPFTAIAACLAAMLVGAAGTLAVLRTPSAVAPSSAVVAGGASVIPVTNAVADKRRVIRFALVAPGASHVSIVGDFNGWDPQATPLTAVRDGGTWLIDMPLSVGRHVYAFVVDGDLVADPSAPRVVDHDFGVQNSVVLVGSL